MSMRMRMRMSTHTCAREQGGRLLGVGHDDLVEARLEAAGQHDRLALVVILAELGVCTREGEAHDARDELEEHEPA